MASIQKQIESYLLRHGIELACLRKGLINYSALSRKILKELGLPERNFDAVLVACRRFAEKIEKSDYEKRIFSILKRAKIKIITGLYRIVLPKAEIKLPARHIINGEKFTTLIAEEEQAEEILKEFSEEIIEKKGGLAEIVINTSKSADKLLGFAAFLTNCFANNGINIQTLLGSYEEDIFIIEEKDVQKALELLRAIKSSEA